MNMKKKLLIIAVLAGFMAVLGACGSNAPSDQPPETQTEGTPDGSESGDQNQDEPEQPAATLKGTGTYVGQVDNNSIEITVDGEPAVFRFGDQFDRSVLDDLEPNAEVEFEYTEQPIEDDLKVLLLSKLTAK